MSYESETRRTFNRNRKLYLNTVKVGNKHLPDPVHMIYSYDPDGTGGAGTRLSVRQANKVLKPFNMKAVSTNKGRWILVVQKDYNMPTPTNWSTVADTVLVWHPDEDGNEAFEDAWKAARLGRKSWRKLYESKA